MDSKNSKDVSYLRRKCLELKLDGAGILYKYSDDQLSSMYNGIGPAVFPDWIVDILGFINPDLEAPCMIHDVEWSESDGTDESFTASNKRLRNNGIKVAKDRYAWYDPRRYIVIYQSLVLSRACQTFGIDIWRAYSYENSLRNTGYISKIGRGFLLAACRYNRDSKPELVDPFD